MVVAALSAWHERCEAAAAALAEVKALPAHVVIETYSVLTRLPSGLAVPAAEAASVIARRFPDPPLRLDDAERRHVLSELAAAAVYGGSTYDGIVAVEARAHGEELLTLDERAQPTYARLGAAYRVIGT